MIMIGPLLLAHLMCDPGWPAGRLAGELVQG